MAKSEMPAHMRSTVLRFFALNIIDIVLLAKISVLEYLQYYRIYERISTKAYCPHTSLFQGYNGCTFFAYCSSPSVNYGA